MAQSSSLALVASAHSDEEDEEYDTNTENGIDGDREHSPYTRNPYRDHYPTQRTISDPKYTLANKEEDNNGISEDGSDNRPESAPAH